MLQNTRVAIQRGCQGIVEGNNWQAIDALGGRLTALCEAWLRNEPRLAKGRCLELVGFLEGHGLRPLMKLERSLLAKGFESSDPETVSECNLLCDHLLELSRAARRRSARLRQNERCLSQARVYLEFMGVPVSALTACVL
jgi:hypothetical protein